MRLIIPNTPPSQNVTERMHWAKRGKQKKEWEEIVGWEAIRQKVIPKIPYQKAKVRLIYFFPIDRGQDPDNFNGKFLLDGMRKIGIIKNDTFKNLDLKVELGGYDNKNPRVEILFEEVIT